MSEQELKIPKMRVAVLIGTNGETKREIEDKLKIQLDVTKEGQVSIQGEDSLKTFLARKVVKAIGRGFPPDIAMLLIREDYDFELIEIMEFARSKNDLFRLRGRVIGEKGKSRKKIEKVTGCSIIVFGKTVGIIGPIIKLEFARRAILRLLRGAKHGSVFKLMKKESKK